MMISYAPSRDEIASGSLMIAPQVPALFFWWVLEVRRTIA
jgi:hypothetical protein